MQEPAYSNGHDTVLILYLALVTGLLALGLYYYGLQRTPAMVASLAELTYPAVAIVAGIYAYGQHLSWTQWVGVALIIGSVTLLPMRRRRIVTEPPHRRQGELVPAAASA
jgi:drug/metabolite transporter (DMT)-like permease